MGQYWIPVNLDKKEFISPHKLGSGLKMVEMLWNRGVGEALIILQSGAVGVGRGGGDFDHNAVIGRWAGDRVVIVSDYMEDGDRLQGWRAGDPPVGEIYSLCDSYDPRFCTAEEWDERARRAEKFGGLFADISELVAAVIEHECNVLYVGTGWRQRIDKDALKHAGYNLGDPANVERARKLDYHDVVRLSEAYDKALEEARRQ